jgi:hypothetical protein
MLSKSNGSIGPSAMSTASGQNRLFRHHGGGRLADKLVWHRTLRQRELVELLATGAVVQA